MTTHTTNLTKLQYLAWFELSSFFVVIGPTILIFLAASGVNPLHQPNTVTISVNRSTPVPTRETVTVALLLYKADRNMTLTEHQILQRVRRGCGRHYVRSFIEQWDHGVLVKGAFGCITYAIIAPVVSSVLFLMLVPGDITLFKLLPLTHLIVLLSSVACCLVGNFFLTKSSLCFLNHVFANFPLQVILPVLSTLICLSYKVYEIKIAILYCKDHFAEWKTEEYFQSNSEDVEKLVKQLEELDKKEEEIKEGDGDEVDLLRRESSTQSQVKGHDAGEDVGKNKLPKSLRMSSQVLNKH